MDYAKNLSVAVAALFLAACADEIPCLATGAVKTENGCLCPEGTRLEEDLEAQTSACVEDAGVDISPSGAEDSGSSKQDAGSMDAASEDGAVEQRDAERHDADSDGDTAPEDDADSMTLPDEQPTCEPTPEECDGRDNDCDGDTNEEVTKRCWVDGDGDGYAAADAEVTVSCDECGARQTAIGPSAANLVDCDDDDPTRSPGATDVCGDMIDNDCDGRADEEANNACDGPCTTQLIGEPGAACNNGLEGACAAAGVYECAEDGSLRCSAPTIAPKDELCDGKDNDCDDQVDNLPLEPCTAGQGICISEGVYECRGGRKVCTAMATLPKWFPDCDNDGVAVSGSSVDACTRPAPTADCTNWRVDAPVVSDCDDSDPRVFPGAEPLVTSNAPNATEESRYIGDTNCDGRVEKPSRWEYYDDFDGRWVAADYPLCTANASCDTGGQPCYRNDEQAGAALDCGNTEITIHRFTACSASAVTARLVCR